MKTAGQPAPTRPTPQTSLKTALENRSVCNSGLALGGNSHIVVRNQASLLKLRALFHKISLANSLVLRRSTYSPLSLSLVLPQMTVCEIVLARAAAFYPAYETVSPASRAQSSPGRYSIGFQKRRISGISSRRNTFCFLSHDISINFGTYNKDLGTVYVVSEMHNIHRVIATRK